MTSAAYLVAAALYFGVGLIALLSARKWLFALTMLVAVLVPVFCGCTTSSVLSDSEQEYPWLPARTSYDHLVDQCAGKRVGLIFRDGRNGEGFLVHASADSIFWRTETDLDPAGCATADLVQISEPFHVIPEIVGTVVGTFFGGAVGLGIALPQGESGGAHPVSAPDGPIYVGAAAGAVVGFLVGKGFSTEHLYLIDTVSLRQSRPAVGTR